MFKTVLSAVCSNLCTQKSFTLLKDKKIDLNGYLSDAKEEPLWVKMFTSLCGACTGNPKGKQKVFSTGSMLVPHMNAHQGQ